jgi:CheY-like chemotaxis protein
MRDDHSMCVADATQGRGIPMSLGVLIVEDSRVARGVLTSLLAEVGGFEVLAVAGGETEAIDWLHHHNGEWDLALLDLLLAEGSGFNLIRRCKLQPKAGKVAVFSDYVTDAIAQRCIALGADAAFAKSQADALKAFLAGLAREDRG